MLHNDRSWNNSWKTAAQYFLAQVDHQSWGIYSYGDLPSNYTKPTKKLTQTSWFQTNFAVVSVVYLCWNESVNQNLKPCMLRVCQNNPHHTSLPISSSLQPCMLLPITSICACASELCVQRKPNQGPNIRNSHECVPLLKWNESHDQPRDVNMAVLACAPKIYLSTIVSIKQMQQYSGTHSAFLQKHFLQLVVVELRIRGP